MAGVEKDFDGETLLSEGYTVGYLEQEPLLDNAKTVRADRRGRRPGGRGRPAEFDAINARFGEDLTPDEMDALLDPPGRGAGQARRPRTPGTWTAAWNWRWTPCAARPAIRPVSVLSGGERRRVALCRLLLQAPDILLLDEPTNHLDAESVAWLEKHLQQYAGTVIAVTHDRYFLDNVAGWILELDRGYGIPWKGNYSSWLEQKQQRLAPGGKDRPPPARRRWSASSNGCTCRPRRSRPSARRASTPTTTCSSQEMETRARGARDLHPARARAWAMSSSASTASTKAYGDNLLYDDLSLDIPPGAIVGIIGPNGAGKTTLFRLIVGQEQPDAGSVAVGGTVQLAYVDQSARRSTPTRPSGRRSPAATSSCAWATTPSTRAPTSAASTSPAPTSRRRSARSPAASATASIWPSCSVPAPTSSCSTSRATTSTSTPCAPWRTPWRASPAPCWSSRHDRWFLDRIATHILAFEGDSQVFWYPGNYTEYEADRHRRLGAIADRPHRITYRKLRRA